MVEPISINSTNMNDLSDKAEETAASACAENNNAVTNLSKRQLKRLKKIETWKETLPEKRRKEKLKLKIKREEARKNNITLGPTRHELKNKSMANSDCKIRVGLDFSFDHLMTNKDICKCISQTLRCYSINRRADNPLQFYIFNLNGESLNMMSRHNGYKNWDLHIHQKPYLEVLPKEDIVYLSSESDNVLEKLEDNKIYIIGALVDHNSQKGLCLKIANEQGIQHARLPIGEYLNMKSRKVLAVNHVFEIILKFCNGQSWKEALLNGVPQRKCASGKEHDGSVSSPNEINDES